MSHRRARLLRALCALPFLGFLGMWPLSYELYTSVGLDTDWDTGPGVIQTQWRMRWPGGGSFLLGADEYWKAASEPLERFDLGGGIFETPRPPVPRSPWNRLGFWRLRVDYRTPLFPVRKTSKRCEYWWGVPSWLPVLLTGLLPLGLEWRERRLKRTGPREAP